MTNTTSHECPYQGLRPYTEAEREYFFGRESVQEVIASNLRIAPLTILYGGSGVGKSSVLQAGVIPLLEEDPRVIVVLFDQWQGESFNLTLKTLVLKAVCDNTGSTEEDALRKISDAAEFKASSLDDLPLDDLLIASADVFNRRILLIFDQFEEYFLYHTTSTRAEGFDAEFARAVHHQGSAVHFMISMREEQLSKLDRFRARIPNLLTNLLRLDNLDLEGATSAIKSPLLVYNLKYPGTPMDIEPALVDAIIREVSLKPSGNQNGADERVPSIKPKESSLRIDTPFLQLVLSRLWQAERDRGSHMLRLGTFQELGGAATIAGTHFDSVMGKLHEHRQTAAAVLSYLVTPTGSKIAQHPATLAKWGKVNETEVEKTLNLLSSQGDMRILRKISLTGQPDLYELSHDVLGRPIIAWLSSYEKEQERITADKQLMHERARVKWRTFLVALMGVLVVVMAGAMLYAYLQKREANRSQLVARAQQLAAGAWAELSRDPELSYLLASEAVETLPNADNDQLQREVMQYLLESRLRTVIRGHEGPVLGATYSRDGGRILTLGASDRTVRLWEASRGGRISELRLNETVYSARISPDGNLIATTSWEGTTRVSSANTSQSVLELKEQVGGLHLAVFSPDSKFLATAPMAGGVRVWEINTGREVLPAVDSSFGNSPFALTFSPDGTQVVGVNSSGVIVNWNLSSGKVISEWPGGGQSVAAVAFSSDTQQVYIADVEQNSFIKNVKTGKQISELKSQRGAPQTGAFSSDGKYLVTTSRYDTAAWVWETATGRLLRELLGHTDRLNNAEFSPDGNFIVTASSDGTTRVWSMESGQSVSNLRGHKDEVYEARFSRDGKSVLTASADGTARTWQPFGEGELLVGHRDTVVQGVFSRDGRLAITAGMDASARLWDISTRQTVAEFSGQHRVGLYDVALSSDGKLIATAGGDESFSIWDVASRQPTENPSGHIYEIISVAFSPDDRFVLTGSNDASAKLWETGTGKLLHTFQGHESGVVAQFSHDGTKIVTGSADNTARIWSLESKLELHWLAGPNGHKGIVTTVAFSGDDRYVITASRDRTAKIWDVGTGELVRDLVGHTSAVSSAQFSLDSRLVITASSDHTVQIWEAATGRNLAILRRHVGPIDKAAFSPDGKLIISTGYDNTARLYSCDICVPTSEVLTIVRERIHGLRDFFTEEEKKKYAVE